MSNTKEQTKTLEEILSKNGIEPAEENAHNLILWNDDVNSFEWVQMLLIQFLKFSPTKAESTAYEVHLKGKSIIKSGSVEELKTYKDILEENGLTLSIE